MKKSFSILFSTSVVLLFACIMYFCGVSDVYAQGFQKVHLITLQEDQGVISPACSNDVYGINSLFLEWKNKSDPVNLSTSDGKNKILREIEKVNVGKDDVLFFYYAGHGESDNNNNLFLILSRNEKIDRQELRKILERKNARLTVYITDACAASYQNNEGPSAIQPDDSYLLSNLNKLFLCKGVVDVNSSTPPNEYAISTEYVSRKTNESYTGGVFTQSFLFLINESRQDTWADLLKNTSKEVNNR
ncbi:MAG: caspase family protein [Thermoguttaceae bacterium]